jgi:hypothetical protein
LNALDPVEGGIRGGTPRKIVPFMEYIELLNRAGENGDLDPRHSLISQMFT